MRRFLLLVFCLLAGLLASCSNHDEEKRQELIKSQIDIVRREFRELDDGRKELNAGLANMRELLSQANAEVDRGNARVFVIKSITPFLRELTNGSYLESPGKWILENPAFGTNVLLLLAFFTFVLWLLWRFRSRHLEQMMSVEIDNVIRRLSTESAAAPRTRTATAPAAPKPAASTPAPAPKPRAAPPKAPAAMSAAVKPGPAKEQAPEPPVRREKAEKAPPKAAAEPKDQSPESGNEAAAPASVKRDAPASEPKKPKARAERKTEKKAAPVKAAKKKSPRRAAAKKCKIKGCNNKHRSKGLCNKHYQQWRKGVLLEEVED